MCFSLDSKELRIGKLPYPEGPDVAESTFGGRMDDVLEIIRSNYRHMNEFFWKSLTASNKRLIKIGFQLCSGKETGVTK